MKEFTLAKPQGSKPHRSRESIAFYRKDGTPVDLGAIFETDGDLALSMLAADQVIGWVDGPSLRMRDDGYGLLLVDPGDEGLVSALQEDFEDNYYGRLGADWLGVYSPIGFAELGTWGGEVFLNLRDENSFGAKLKPRPTGGLDLIGGPLGIGDEGSILDTIPLADWGGPSLWGRGDFNAMGWVGAIQGESTDTPMTASGSSAYLTPDGAFWSYLPPTGDPVVMRVKRTSEPFEAPFLMKAEGKMEWRTPGDAVGSPARATLKRHTISGDGLQLEGGPFEVVGPIFASEFLGDAGYAQLASDGIGLEKGPPSTEQAYIWLYPDGHLEMQGTTGPVNSLEPSDSGGLTLDTALGHFGHTPPTVQPAAPVDLAGVIQVLKDYGLVAS